jgi:hypothetical protein
MGVHKLGVKHLRRLSRALGQPVYRAWLDDGGHNSVAICWIDRAVIARIDYRTLEIVTPPTADHCYGIGWHDDASKPPNPLLAS